jgi:polyhydroxyalkanoate synthesis regulator phasin
VEVEDGKLAYQKALQICQELGGYMASSNFYKDSQGREAGTITMRIPKEKFESAVDKLGALGKVESSNTDSRDVSQEYANLKTQLDAAMVVYNKMMEALQKKQVTIPEAVRLESELTPILRRIQDLKNRLEYLDNAISYTTITVNVHEPVVSVKVLKDSKRQIKESLINTGVNTIKFIAGVIPVAVLLFFWLIILGIVAFLVKYLVAKLFKRA